MIKRPILLAVLAVLSMCLPASGQPWSGSGTEEDPYLIKDANDMQAVGADPNYWDAHFKLVNDINLAEYTGTEFNIIGNESNPFTGVFDGNDYTISNFSYATTGVNYIGLFVRNGGEIKNLGMIAVNIDAGTGSRVGGLVGHNGGPVSNCYATGSVGGASFVGGLVGYNIGACSVSNCYTTGTVSGDRSVGGLVGLSYSTVSNCYTSSTVSGNTRVGGLVGYNLSLVSNCYATGSVGGASMVGGLVGHNAYDVIASFWDIDTSGQATSDGGTGKTTAQMQTLSTFVSAGWDFGAPVWVYYTNGYPRLAWEPTLPIGDINHDGRVDWLDFAYFADHWLEGVEL